MTFRKGLDHIQESIERGNRSFSGTRRNYFKWEAGQEQTIRFLTEGDAIVLANMHEFVLCHDGSKRSFVCRKEVGEDCELCDNPDIRRREVGYAVAVAREARKVDGKTTFVDKTVEIDVEENGKTVKKTVPWVGILQQAPRNFWAFFWAAHDKYGTLRDRDYSITRRGSGMETTYNAFYEEPEEIPNIDTRYSKYVPDIEEMLTYLSSKEYYDKWLHGIETPKDDTATPSKPVENAELTDADLESLRKANEELKAEVVVGDYE